MPCPHTVISSGSSISFHTPARLSDIRLLGISVRALCSSLGFNTTETFQLELAVVEAANNIVFHAYHQKDHTSFDMDFSVTQEKIICTFTDQGKPADFLHKHSQTALCDNIQRIPENNRGICIICNVMDEVTYTKEERGNVLTMVKYLPHHIE